MARRLSRISLSVASAALTVGLCGTVQTSTAGASQHLRPHGTITFAEQPGSPPSYLFPIYNGNESGNNNITDLQPLMWLPLYWFGSNTDPSLVMNEKQSVALPPVFSNGNKTITIRLKPYHWSTGTRVTARDLTFWMNLVLAERTNYSNYVPGGWMDHVASYRATSPTTFVLHMSVGFNRTYLIDDALATLTPIPQQTWDRTSATGAVGNYDTTPAGAKRVYKYLDKASKTLSTWDTNPIWQVVDGPWHIVEKTGFQVTGQLTLVPNTKYSGPNRPKVSELKELPFLSASSEFEALKSGSVDYGYVPATDLAQLPALRSGGFKIDPWYEWGITYVTVNYSNPKYGAIVSQLYVRQAMQSLIDQPLFIKQLLGGYATPTYGPVPSYPKSPFLSSKTLKNPYPLSVAKAKRLISSHGWVRSSSGVAVCVRPGRGAHNCGAGIAAHTRLELPLTYSSGIASMSQEAQAMQTAMKAVGIELTLRTQLETTVGNNAYQCQGKSRAKCPASSPTLSFYESPTFTYVPTYYPIATMFSCNAPTNPGNYCEPVVQRLLTKLPLATGPGAKSVFAAMNRTVARQLPVLWMPNEAVQVSAISSKLGGVVAQQANGYINPSTWFVKS